MSPDSKDLRQASRETRVEWARALIEAMPYIHSFRKKTIVIKYGGNAMIDEKLKESVTRDIVMLETIGMNPVVVHGGGPGITQMLKRVGKETTFVNGLRVTDQDTMNLTEGVLAGNLSGELVDRINRAGGRAVGLSGKDAGLVLARRIGSGKENAPDIGYVGEVVRINTDILNVLDDHGFIPVIAPIGVDTEGNGYNINADTMAAEVAKALSAEKLILMTDVAGVQYDPKDPSTVISEIRRNEIQRLIEKGIITGGMIPKLQACAESLDHGVRKVHIIDGRIPHALLLELLTDQGIGTQILP